MATKQEVAVKRAVTKEKNRGKVREEKHVLWFLIAIILLLLYLLLAQWRGWWPYSPPKLGSAFYTNVSAQTSAPDSTSSEDGGSDGSNGSDGSDGSDGSNGSNGSNGGNNGGGGSTSDALLDFAAKVNVGDTKEEISGQANGLGEGCAVLVGADVTPQAGHQEVCTYTEGDKIVTVTYLNDRVISASKSGF